METHVSDISHVIQLAVAPVFLLTAIATMINAMNTRLVRVVDRRRVIEDRLLAAPRKIELEVELTALIHRSHLAYRGIFCAVLAALLVCLVVAGAFIGALIAVDLSKAVAVTFVLAMSSMIVALGMFLREVYLGVSFWGSVRR
jgi:hypothetical protein